MILTLVKYQGLFYRYILIDENLTPDDLPFELLEISRGDVTPDAIKKAKETLAKRDMYSYVANSIRQRFKSKIMK